MENIGKIMGNTSDIGGRKTRVTIKDVASAANVSIATVSYVLNNKPGQSISEDTRKKVLQTANLLGYECNVMARYLATGKSNTVAVVVKDIDGMSAHYYINLITELTNLFAKHNYELKLCGFADELSRTGGVCDAYITLALSEQDFRSFADTKYVPVVAVDTVLEDFLFYRINDDFKAMYNAAKSALPKASKIELLTYPLSEECLRAAEEAFDGVKVIHSPRDIAVLDGIAGYATQSKAIADSLDSPVYCAESSCSNKAAAAVGAVNAAIDRINASYEAHNIKV